MVEKWDSREDRLGCTDRRELLARLRTMSAGGDA
jgi:hypothetical protein